MAKPARVTIGNYLDPLNPQLLEFAIKSGLALVHFQKNWLLTQLADASGSSLATFDTNIMP